MHQASNCLQDGSPLGGKCRAAKSRTCSYYSRLDIFPPARRKNVETRKIERIPTTRGSTFFRDDNSISQLDCRKFFRLEIFPPRKTQRHFENLVVFASRKPWQAPQNDIYFPPQIHTSESKRAVSKGCIHIAQSFCKRLCRFPPSFRVQDS